MSLSGLKDIDREILKYVDDGELLKICSVDKKTWNEVCDDNFLKRRLSQYPGIEKYKGQKSWKKFFSNVIFFISRMREDLKFYYKSGDFMKQYRLLTKTKEDKDCRYKHAELLANAVKEEEIDLVKYSLNNGAIVNQYNNAPLRQAVVRGNLDIIKFLIERGADTTNNIVQYSYNPETVKFLMEQGADIHQNNGEALTIASASGNLNVVKYLIENGINVKTEGRYALIMAISKKHLNVVKYLLEKEAPIHRVGGGVLGAASSEGNLEVIKYLLENGANIHIENDYALKIASSNGYLEIVKYLIQHGSGNISKALKKAEKNNHTNIVKYLQRLI